MTAPGARTDLTSYHDDTKSAALTKAGISKVQASQWERLAAIPAEQFEADLADPMWRPTTASRGDEDALWLWGALIDLKERGLLARDQRELMATPILDHNADDGEVGRRIRVIRRSRSESETKGHSRSGEASVRRIYSNGGGCISKSVAGSAGPLRGSAWPLMVLRRSNASSALTRCAARRCSKAGELSGGVASICIGLPQARSSNAVAAATTAAGGDASLSRTRTSARMLAVVSSRASSATSTTARGRPPGLPLTPFTQFGLPLVLGGTALTGGMF